MYCCVNRNLVLDVHRCCSITSEHFLFPVVWMRLWRWSTSSLPAVAVQQYSSWSTTRIHSWLAVLKCCCASVCRGCEGGQGKSRRRARRAQQAWHSRYWWYFLEVLNVDGFLTHSRSWEKHIYTPTGRGSLWCASMGKPSDLEQKKRETWIVYRVTDRQKCTHVHTVYRWKKARINCIDCCDSTWAWTENANFWFHFVTPPALIRSRLWLLLQGEIN